MTPTDHGTTLKTLVAAYERRLILDALEATGGHQRRTAQRLGVLPTTLHEKMKRLGLISRGRYQWDVRAPGSSDVHFEPAHHEAGLVLAAI